MYQEEQMTLEELLTRLVSSFQAETENRFDQGADATILNSRGMKVSEIATIVNCSAALIRERIKTFRAFPQEEDRLPYAELSHYHFRLAAGTTDPHHWIAIAADHNLSTREFSKLIRGEVIKDELREAERIYGTVERAIQAGGRGARYLYDKLTCYLRGIDLDVIERSYTTAEAGETQEENTGRIQG